MVKEQFELLVNTTRINPSFTTESLARGVRTMATTAKVFEVRFAYTSNNYTYIQVELVDKLLPALKADENNERQEVFIERFIKNPEIFFNELKKSDPRFEEFFETRVAKYPGKLDLVFDRVLMKLLFNGTELVIEPTLHEVGDTYIDYKGRERVAETRDYYYTIVGVKWNEVIENSLQTKYAPRTLEQKLADYDL